MNSFKRHARVAVFVCATHLRRYFRQWAAVLAFVVLSVVGYFFVLAPPADFSSGSTLVIAHGASVPLIAEQLAEAHIIAHPSALRLLVRIIGADSRIQAGVYRFNRPENLFTVMYRLVTGAYGLPPIRLTFVEGTTVREMAVQIAAAFPEISPEDFLAAGQSAEGYLFPDTYFFSPSADAASIVKTMRSNFNAKIASLTDQLNASKHSLSDIVIMASLLEKEARTSANRRIVAGILYNRLKLGMPLQVDAVFGYIYGRSTYSPSYADLAVNSPYNTYLHTGLPPGPIDNPGLDSLEAALNPTKTNYLYYLTDKNGVMHYTTTYAQHQANKRKYLN
ncbi:MAG TPA: endolytic transglycosylase MltG [Candidatus Paceibacterota bacterium]|nr:endolytic transglycosylase MltG [Candidatus Paceibacterota bacterium]